MHGPMQCATRKQVDVGSLELARTRPTQDEAEALFFNEPMHLIKQTGQPLHFVNNHPPVGWNRAKFVCEKAWTSQQPLVCVLGQQVDYVRARKSGSKPCAFAGATGAHEEETLFRGFEYPEEHDSNTLSSFFIEK